MVVELVEEEASDDEEDDEAVAEVLVAEVEDAEVLELEEPPETENAPENEEALNRNRMNTTMSIVIEQLTSCPCCFHSQCAQHSDPWNPTIWEAEKSMEVRDVYPRALIVTQHLDLYVCAAQIKIYLELSTAVRAINLGA